MGIVPPPAAPATSYDRRALIRDYGASIVVAILAAVLIRVFVIEAYRIPSQAMRPTLEPGDVVFVWKWGFWRGKPPTPKRGDVVVFSPPGSGGDYIKRVIGLPGDEVRLHEGKITLNGQALGTGELHGTCGSERVDAREYPVCWEPPPMKDFGPEKVPQGSVFVVGDLRSGPPGDTNSAAMRSATPTNVWGIFPVSALKGRAVWVWLSLEQQNGGLSGGWFPRFRFDRMFRRLP